VQKRPVPLTIAATMIMVVLTIPLFSLRLGSSDAGNNGDLRVSVDETAEPVVSDDLGVSVHRVGECPEGTGLSQGPVRAMSIEVGFALGEDLA
jgi:hypothetical protein